jgi:hypothetical protein
MPFLKQSSAAVRVGGERHGEDLQRNFTPQLGIVCAVYLTHAAGADERRDRVRAEWDPGAIDMWRSRL